MRQVQETFVDVGATRLLVRRVPSAADDGARPLLFWHGGGGASLEMPRFVPALASAGHVVLVPDGPGYGRSPPIHQTGYRPSALSELAVSLMDALGLPKVAWVGSSWGATIGVHTAARFPERFTGLVLLDAGYLDAADNPGFDPEGALERTSAALRARMEQGEVWDAPVEVIAIAMHAQSLEPCGPLLPVLGASGIPVLLLRATEPSRDEGLRAAAAQRFQRAVPHADIVPVPGVGHFLLRDAEPVVERLVIDWLGRVRAG